MPTYKYECAACAHAFELFQSMTAPVKRKCPECGKSKLQRLIGAGAGILFKGAGFYETDYRSASYRDAAKADSDSGAKVETPAAGAASTDGGTKPPSDQSKPDRSGADRSSADRRKADQPRAPKPKADG